MSMLEHLNRKWPISGSNIGQNMLNYEAHLRISESRILHGNHSKGLVTYTYIYAIFVFTWMILL